MMATTKIEWAERVWNPVTGCDKVSPGCQNCYAERMAKRLRGRHGYPKDEPFKVTLHPDRLDQPLKWRKPSRIFVCSMGDLFHEDVPDEFIDQIFFKIVRAKRHNFLILTKRPLRMWKYIETFRVPITTGSYHKDFEHLWLGVTAENQEQADKRIPILLQIPAAVRFVSIEPMLEGISLAKWCHPEEEETTHIFGETFDWVIVGAESGAKRRPPQIEWIENIVEQCRNADVPIFVKQIEMECLNPDCNHRYPKFGKENHGHLSKDPSEWPEQLRIRQYPTPASKA